MKRVDKIDTLLKDLKAIDSTKYKGYEIEMIKCEYDSVTGIGDCEFWISNIRDIDKTDMVGLDEHFSEKRELYFDVRATGACTVNAICENDTLYITYSFLAKI